MGAGRCTPICERLRSLNLTASDLTKSAPELVNHLGLTQDDLHRGVALGTLEDLESRHECPVCRLIVQVLAEHREKQPQPTRATSDVAGDLYPDAAGDVVRLYMFPDEACFRLSHPSQLGTRLMIVCDESLNASEVREDVAPYIAREVKDEQIRTATLSNWLRQCDTEHGDSCRHIPLKYAKKREGLLGAFDESLTSNFRLLDLEAWCVRYMPLNTPYVALSYVWGQVPTFRLLQENFERLQVEGSLKEILSQIPQTIADAITLVKSIGLRYLWVDTLCLLQDKAEDVELGMELMMTVYQGSYFTLVAGSGDHARSGLPGVRPQSRTPGQLVARLNDTLKLAAVHSIDWHLTRSVYNERGWTLQELVLPYRTVIFINGQVYFRCQKANWSEETLADRCADWLDPDDFNISRKPDAYDSNLGAWWAYQKLFEDFSKRTIRYDEDALRAVAGILRVLSGGLASRMLEGLPNYWLDPSLLFISSDGDMRRREGFASYSWAGWTGRIMWPRENYSWPDDAGELKRDPAHLFRWIKHKSLIKWSVYPQTGQVQNVDGVEAYGTPRRLGVFAAEYAEFLPGAVVERLQNLPHNDTTEYYLGGGSGSFCCHPRFGDEESGLLRNKQAYILQWDVMTSRAEFEMVVAASSKRGVMALHNWLASRRFRSRRYRMNSKDKKPLPGPASPLGGEWTQHFKKRVLGAPVLKRHQGREGYAAEAIEKARERGEAEGMVAPIFPPYPVLLFTTVSITLTAGRQPEATAPDPSRPDPLMDQRRTEADTHSNHMFSRRPGIPLISGSGELVGSLHPDNFSDASCQPGAKVECLLLSGCVEPTLGSALGAETLGADSGKAKDLFWVLQIVWIHGIAYRHGVGQIIAGAFTSTEFGPEVKTVMLG